MEFNSPIGPTTPTGGAQIRATQYHYWRRGVTSVAASLLPIASPSLSVSQHGPQANTIEQTLVCYLSRVYLSRRNLPAS